jgi:hypothetical protein
MAWALGANFNFPRFVSAVNRSNPDFFTAAIESHINEEGNEGVAPRNDADVVLFNNAGIVLRDGLDPNVLYWPQSLAAPNSGPIVVNPPGPVINPHPPQPVAAKAANTFALVLGAFVVGAGAYVITQQQIRTYGF